MVANCAIAALWWTSNAAELSKTGNRGDSLAGSAALALAASLKTQCTWDVNLCKALRQALHLTRLRPHRRTPRPPRVETTAARRRHRRRLRIEARAIVTDHGIGHVLESVIVLNATGNETVAARPDVTVPFRRGALIVTVIVRGTELFDHKYCPRGCAR